MSEKKIQQSKKTDGSCDTEWNQSRFQSSNMSSPQELPVWLQNEQYQVPNHLLGAPEPPGSSSELV